MAKLQGFEVGVRIMAVKDSLPCWPDGQCAPHGGGVSLRLTGLAPRADQNEVYHAPVLLKLPKMWNLHHKGL